MGTRIIRSLTPPAAHEAVAATIGCFDGWHLGHRYLLQKVQENAGEAMGTAVISFEPHPLKVLQPTLLIKKINTVRQQYQILNQLHFNYYYLLRFSRALSQVSAPDFAHCLFEKIRCRYLIVGEGFQFGYKGAGTTALLQQMAVDYDAQVEVAQLRESEGVISSQRVRLLLQSGEFSEAAKLLGRCYTIEGRVQRGQGKGTGWGFPTANIKLKYPSPCEGVFAAWAWVGGKRYPSSVSIGTRPTVSDKKEVVVEAHLLNFSQDLYRQRISIVLVKKIRDEHHFATIDLLKRAVFDDIEKTKVILQI